jgi:hypothetical protein
MRKPLNVLFAAAVWAIGLNVSGSVAAAGGPAPTTVSPNKLAVGLSPTLRLLQLMDTDRNGKVSKDEFMHFMEAEFDFADKNKDGELDPKELQALLRSLSHPTSHPLRGPGK